MKTNHRLIVKLVTLGLLISLVGVFTQCVANNTKQVGGSNSNNSYTPGPLDNDQDEGQEINAALVSEGIKSHEQILNTMSTLTGVSVTNNNVRTVYNQVATTLPTDNDIKVFLPPHQLAVTRLAAEFCQAMVESTTLRVVVWPNFPFTALPATALSAANTDELIENVIDAFWGDIVPAAEKSDAKAELEQLVEDLQVGESTATATTTRNVVKGVCTAVLSSAHVTLL